MYIQVVAVFAGLRLGASVVTVGPFVYSANVGERASATSVQRDDVAVLDVHALDQVNLADWVFVIVVRPADTWLANLCIGRFQFVLH